MGAEFDFYKEAIRALFNAPACVTWVRGADISAIVRELGGNEQGLSEGEFNDLFEAYEMDADEGVALISSVGEWTLVVELTRYLGIKHPILEALSRSSEALSLAWTVELDTEFGYAAKGWVSRSFDPFQQGTDYAEPEHLRWANKYNVTARNWQEDWMAAAFTVAERISGIRIDRGWKEQRHLILRVGDVFQAEEAQARPDLILKEQMWELVSRYPHIADIAADPSQERLNEVKLITVELTVRAAKLEGPLIDRALGAIGQAVWGAPVQELHDELAVMAANYLAAATVVLEDGGDVLMPSFETDWGRLYMKHYAVQGVMAALRLEDYRGLLASMEYGKLVTVSQRKSNDSYRLLRILGIIGYYLANGENSLSG
ncbi:DUF6461 domain-containing protein [Streptosporangium canum]|uniref:DUF6461 domain-containing protein n=1 Tax=Streptosporangium canum TaxID=324952 RepID=UPI00341FB53B